MTAPLVSVITATYRRHRELLGRCIPSVAAQTYEAIEHVVVSDGPDPELQQLLAETGARYGESEHGGHWGHLARLKGIEMATGELIAWLDDDDAWRPDHVALHAAALEEHPEAGFAYSRLLIGAQDANARTYRDDPEECLGTDVYASGQVLTSMLFHRRAVLDVATWGTGTGTPDSDLVSAWADAGIPYVSIPQVSSWMWTHDDYDHPGELLLPDF
jgi:glycosyltransferase involved in cell wall biosynthesis